MVSQFNRDPSAPLPATDLSRRAALRRLGGGGLAAALALAVGSHRVVARDATPAAIPPLFREWVDAWTARDIERLMDLYTKDAVLEDVAAGVVFQGKEEVRAHHEDELAAFDLIYEPLSAVASGDRMAGEFRWTATYTGTYPGLPPGTGQALTVHVAVFVELAEGKITHEAHYYDLYTVLVRLGLLPAPGAEATPPA